MSNTTLNDSQLLEDRCFCYHKVLLGKYNDQYYEIHIRKTTLRIMAPWNFTNKCSNCKRTHKRKSTYVKKSSA